MIDITKRFEIIYDPLNGEITYKNDDKMTYTEALGAIEYVKMVIMRQFILALEDTP